MQCIVVKSDEFENSSPLYIFPLNPDYVAARSLRSLRSNKGTLHRDLGDYQLAKEYIYYERALSFNTTESNKLGPDHVDFACTYHNIFLYW